MKKRFFLVLLLFFLPLIGQEPWKEQVESIDKRILVLQEQKAKLDSSIQRKVNNAMRWQFQRENYLDARRTWDEVAVEKQKLQEIQDHIDDLKKQKEQILKQHGK